MQVVAILRTLVPILYGLAFVVTMLHFVKRRKGRSRSALVLLVLGAFVHVGLTVHLGMMHGHMPLMSVWEAFSLIALCLVAIDIYIQLSTKIGSISVFVLGAALLFQIIAAVGLEASASNNPALRGALFIVHSGASIAGYAAFAISGLLAALHLLQRRQIKRRKLGFIHSRLPSLGVLDRLSAHAAMTGLVLLTIGILVGAVFAKQVWGAYWSWDPKQVSAATLWVVYALYVLLRKTAGWSGPRSAVLSLVGVVLWAFSFVGVHLMFSSMHDFF